MTLLSRGILELRHVAAQEKTRYAMNGILLHREKGSADIFAVATDGKRLARVNVTKFTDSPQDFPTVAAPDFDASARPKGDGSLFAVLPGDACSELAKALPKGKRVRPILTHVALDERVTDAGTLRAATTNLETSTVRDIRLVDGHFPPYADVMPEPGKGIRITLNVELLAGLVSALHAASQCQGDAGVATLEMTGHADPIIVTVSGRSFAEACGVLMPINSGDASVSEQGKFRSVKPRKGKGTDDDAGDDDIAALADGPAPSTGPIPPPPPAPSSGPSEPSSVTMAPIWPPRS